MWYVESMRAVRCHELTGPSGLRVDEVADPKPGSGEVAIDVKAAGLNFPDVLLSYGKYQFKPKLPYTPGKGPAGVVRAVGAGVTRFKAGDRVIGMNEHSGYAELIVVDQNDVYKLPDSLPFADAASMSLGFDTSWMALRERARIKSVK